MTARSLNTPARGATYDPAESGAAPWSLGALPPGMTVEEIKARRPSLFDGQFETPLMALRESAIEHNVAVMADYCRRHGVDLAPHGKTTMAPQLIARQLAAGAWAVSAATAAHVQVYRAFGVGRILLANQLVAKAAVRWIAAELDADSEFEFFCQVDSVDGVQLLEQTLSTSTTDAHFPVLLELGVADGRAGVRDRETFLEVARAVAACERLSLAGTAGYEASAAQGFERTALERISEYLRLLQALTQTAIDENLIGADRSEVVVATGGSVYFDLVVEHLTTGWRSPRPVRVVLRSGAYIAHDNGIYSRISPSTRNRESPSFRPALEAWGHVLSRPERTIAIIDVGRRDVPDDQGLPVPLRVRHVDGSSSEADDLTLFALNDQHGFLRTPPDSVLRPGDWVGLGVSHPCTAFDKWRLLFMVDDDDHVTDCIRTFF